MISKFESSLPNLKNLMFPNQSSGKKRRTSTESNKASKKFKAFPEFGKIKKSFGAKFSSEDLCHAMTVKSKDKGNHFENCCKNGVAEYEPIETTVGSDDIVEVVEGSFNLNTSTDMKYCYVYHDQNDDGFDAYASISRGRYWRSFGSYSQEKVATDEGCLPYDEERATEIVAENKTDSPDDLFWDDDRFSDFSDSEIDFGEPYKSSGVIDEDLALPEMNEHVVVVETLSMSPSSKRKWGRRSPSSSLDSLYKPKYEPSSLPPLDHKDETCDESRSPDGSFNLKNPLDLLPLKNKIFLRLYASKIIKLGLKKSSSFKSKKESEDEIRTSERKKKKAKFSFGRKNSYSFSRNSSIRKSAKEKTKFKSQVITKETYYRPVTLSRRRKARRHLDAFEFYRAEDEREWARRFEELHVDTKSATAMFKLLQSRLQYSAAYPHFLSLLHHLLLLAPGDLTSPDRWLLFDRVLQQLVTQQADGEDREVAIVDINVNDIVKLLASERELTESRQKISRLEADNADAITELNNREQKIYQISQEKEAVEGALQQMLGQLDSEVKRVEEIEAQKALLQLHVTTLGEQLEQLASGKLTDSVTSQNIRKSILSTTASLSNGGVTMAPPPPPPPPMINSAAPPPPPLPLLNGFGPPLPHQQPNRPAKKVPKSTTQLRALNWSKLPEARVDGTIFATLDESPLYKALDLEDIDRTFDATTTKKGCEGEKTMERKRTMRATNATVLESRRQQNCAILLSKLKLSNEELIRVLLNMDADGVLAPDMVEQLLKFTPTSEEKSMLEEHADEISSYSTADRFLFEISKLDHYEERLRCLLYQKKFRERLAESEPKVTAVSAAAKEVINSKRLRRLLELVLAFGNYMNKGSRGGAYGFKVSSLNKLADVKATSDRSLTLLHYIVRVCSQQWPDILQLERDLPSVHLAAKVSLPELQKEITSLSEGLTYIEREVIWHRAQGGAAPKGDRFRISMTEFSGLATEKLSSLQSQFKEMSLQLARAATTFGEDPKAAQPDELFGNFDTFLESLKDSLKELETSKKREEEEDRKKREVQDRERRAKERKMRLTSSPGGQSSSGSCGKLPNGGSGENGNWEQEENDFDDLISALRSGDVFGKDIDKMRRKKKHSVDQANDRERIPGSHKYA